MSIYIFYILEYYFEIQNKSIILAVLNKDTYEGYCTPNIGEILL